MTGLGLIRATLLRPSSDPTITLVLIAVATVVVLLALMLLVLALIRPIGRDRPDGPGEEDARDAQSVPLAADDYEYHDLVLVDVAAVGPARDDETDEPGPSAARRDRPTRRIGCAGIVAVVFFAVAVATIGMTSTDLYCTGVCHAHRAAMASRAKDAHAGVACVRCHEDGSIAGIVGAPFDRTGHALRRVSPTWGSRMAPVASRSCLACHGDIVDRTTTVKDRGVRVSHRNPLAAGMSCDDCHAGAGHSSRIPASAGMRACTACHNGRTASATCSACHTGDPRGKERPTSASREYRSIRLDASPDCVSCHDETGCDGCHGLRLPHPADFTAWTHARPASFGGRALCLQCHVLAQCTRCHAGMGTAQGAAAHPADWRTSHRRQAATSACDCHWKRLPAAGRAHESYCSVCH